MDYYRLRQALNSKGKAEENRKASHINFYATISGIRQRITAMSHSAKGQIPKRMLAKIARQMRLSPRQMQQFVDCTMSREQWIESWGSGPRPA